MRTLLALGPLVVLAVIGIRWWRRRETPVSDAWRIDHARRQWSIGLDQPAWKWPYRADETKYE